MSTEPQRTSRSRAPFDARGLARLARRAGAIALEATTQRTPEVDAVPKIARQIESWLSREAHGAYPRARIALAHQSGPLPRGEWVLTVDAIDGVDAYVSGLPTWSVALGLVRSGEPYSAAVYAPALRDLYVASSGTLRWQGKTVEPGSSTSGFVLGTGLEKRSILRLRRRRDAEGPLSYHACLVARGAAEGAVLGKLTLREAAPLHTLLRAVGGALVSLKSGKPIDFERLQRGRPTRDRILAAAPGRSEALVARLKKSVR